MVEEEEGFSGKCIDLKDYVDQFPFENLVFEGGGAKGISYPGALLVLFRFLKIQFIFLIVSLLGTLVSFTISLLCSCYQLHHDYIRGRVKVK